MKAAGAQQHGAQRRARESVAARAGRGVVRADAGSGIISVNGAAAHKAQPGDLVIICAYGQLDAAEAAKYKPTLVYVDRENRLTHTNESIPAQAA